MGRRSGKFGVRIRKMKPQPITVKRRQAWGKSEKKEETVLGTLLVSLICFQIFCISRKNQYAESDDDENATTTDPEQTQIGGNDVAGTIGADGPFSSAITDGSTDYADPNLIRVLEYIQSSSTLEYLPDVPSPLPGAVGEANPPAVAAIAAPTSLPLVSTQQAEGQVLDLGDLQLTSLPSCENLSSAPNEQKKESDKKQKKKDKKKKKDSKKTESKEKQAVEKKKKSSKVKDKKKSSKVRDDSSTKIPSVKEWAKQEQKKKKADKKQQKKELKQEKKKQKQLEKQAAKAEKQKKAKKLKEEKEIKKAEKEAAKAKKAAEKAEKATAKAKEAAAKAETKKKEKHSKWERRMQQMLEESDKQMAADLERDRVEAEERKRKQEEKAREMMKSIAKTEQIIKTLQDNLERKEKKVAQLSARRDGKRRISMMVAFKLHYKIANYNRRIHSIGSVINKLKKKIEAKQEEVEKLAPHLLETETEEDEPIPCSSKSLNNADHIDNTITADDNDSILDMLSYFDSESDYSDNEDDDEDLPIEIEGMENIHPRIQELLRRAQKCLEKMDEDRLAEAYEDEPSYMGKGKGPANGRDYIKKCL